MKLTICAFFILMYLLFYRLNMWFVKEFTPEMAEDDFTVGMIRFLSIFMIVGFIINLLIIFFVSMLQKIDIEEDI